MWPFPEIATLGDYPAYWARRDPQRLALRTAERSVTFEELDAAAIRVAAWLGDHAKRDALIGYLGKNSIDFYFALFGVAKTRSGFMPFNWRLAPAELAEHLTDSRTTLVIVEREFATFWDQAVGLLDQAPKVVWIDEAGTLERQIEAVEPHTPAPPAGDDIAIQIYTSGTTGRSKGVMLSHYNLNMSRLCEHLEPAYEWRAGDSFVNGLPNFHLLHIGIGLQCLYNGVAIDIVRTFEPAAMLDAINIRRPTLLTLTPTMLQMLLDDPAAATSDMTSIRTVLYAGSPISVGLLRRAIAQVPAAFMQFYGATEGGGITTLLRPDDHDLNNEARLRSCGKPLPLIDLRLVDADGKDVPVGMPGELLIRQPSITKGYWQQPEQTAASIANGWYKSGDIAQRDAQGYYYIVDRAKDMIVSGGENIYSAEVENALSLHPAVAAVAVIGVPDDRWGEAVRAVVIVRGGSETGEADLIAFARTRLAGYKVPKAVDFVSEFPLVPSGKVSKRALRDMYADTMQARS